MKSLLLLSYCLLQQVLCQFSFCNYQNDRFVTSLTSQLCQFVYGYDRTCAHLQFQSCRYYGPCLSFKKTLCVQHQLVVSHDQRDCLSRCCPVFQKESTRLYKQMNCASKGRDSSGNSSNRIKPNNLTYNSSNSSAINNTNQPSNSNPSYLPTTVSHTGMTEIIIGILLICTLITGIAVAVYLRYRQKQKEKSCQNESERELPVTERKLSARLYPAKQFFKDWQPIQNSRLLQELHEQTAELCSICLDDLANTKLICSHKFHKQCIYEWFRKDLMCPLCKRTSISCLQVRCTRCQSYSYLCTTKQLKATFCTPDQCGECQRRHQT